MCPWTGSAPNQTFSRTDGTRTGSETWQEADANDVAILSLAHDTHDEDLADGIELCLKKDGGNQPSAAIPWNSQRITGYGTPTARTDVQRVDKVQDSSHTYAGESTGTDTITATLTPAITAYAAGQRFTFLAGGTNTGAATINFNTVGAKDLKKGAAGSTALAPGDITEGGLYTVEYDGTNFQLLWPGLGRSISAFAATILDDASAAAVLATLGIATATESAEGLVELATTAEIRSAAAGAKAVMAEDLETAAALVALSSSSSLTAVNWDSGINFSLTLSENTTISNPTNGQPGTFRTIYVVGASGTRTVAFGNQFLGEVPTISDVTSSKGYLLSIYCVTASHFVVSSKRALG